MLNQGSLIKIGDSSGIFNAKCLSNIFILKKKYGALGNIFIIVINKKNIFKKGFKKRIFYGLITVANKKFKRNNGYFIHQKQHRVVLLDFFDKIIAKRIETPLCFELKEDFRIKFIFIRKNVF
jgi:ribosomal protein L14